MNHSTLFLFIGALTSFIIGVYLFHIFKSTTLFPEEDEDLALICGFQDNPNKVPACKELYSAAQGPYTIKRYSLIGMIASFIIILPLTVIGLVKREKEKKWKIANDI